MALTLTVTHLLSHRETGDVVFLSIFVVFENVQRFTTWNIFEQILLHHPCSTPITRLYNLRVTNRHLSMHSVNGKYVIMATGALRQSHDVLAGAHVISVTSLVCHLCDT